MAARFVANPDLDARVNHAFARPHVQEIVRAVAVEATRGAPAGKVWITTRDERVRESHRHTDDQLIPANLRYQVREPGRATTLMRAPRDPSAPVREIANCRCISVAIPGAYGQHVHALPVVTAGPVTTGRVIAEGHRIVESHNAQNPDRAVPFMAEALDAVAARYRGASARRT